MSLRASIVRELVEGSSARPDGPPGAPTGGSVERLVEVGPTVLVEYTVRLHPSVGSAAVRRHAVVSFDGERIASWRDHGDDPSRTSTELPDPLPDPLPDQVPEAGPDAAPWPAAEAAIRDFFDLHQQFGFDGVLAAWRRHAVPDDVSLWHSAEGVRGRGIVEVVQFYSAQHERYPYDGFRYDLGVLASRPRYGAGEITYFLDRPDGGVLTLPATFAVDFDAQVRIRSWRDYSRFWIPS